MGCGAGILLIALLLRVLWLNDKPPHFDEGVNGYFVDQITHTGFYHYDPSNFHGPLHFYGLFVSQTLLGREAWVLRLPVALLSTACVGLVLALRPYLGTRPSLLAALAMAISPGMVFYGRYAIHETELLFFLLLGTLGLLGLWQKPGHRGALWQLGLGITGMILTKETYALHLATGALTLASLRIFNRFSPPAPDTTPGWEPVPTLAAAGPVLATCAGLVLCFYSGCFLDFSSLPGLWETFLHWFHTGTAGASGHEKPWDYWFTLLFRYEWPALLGVAAALLSLLPGTPKALRALAFYGLGTLAAYSLIAYKTPWCLIVIQWPFMVLAGCGIDWALRRLDGWIAGTGAALLLGHSALACGWINFREATNENEPYVYVQTLPEIRLLVDPLRTLARRDPMAFHLPGYLVGTEMHPLTWLLGDFTRLHFHDAEHPPKTLADAKFLLIDQLLVETLEPKLAAAYFKTPLRLRGNSADSAMLYLHEETFRCFFPGRHAEFTPERIDLSTDPAAAAPRP
jgi:uncharacterized protein (TIGR03663 family)